MVFTAAPPTGQTLRFCTTSSVFFFIPPAGFVCWWWSEKIQKHCSALWVMYENISLICSQNHLSSLKSSLKNLLQPPVELKSWWRRDKHTKTSRIISTFPALLFHQNQLLSRTPSSTNMAAWRPTAAEAAWRKKERAGTPFRPSGDSTPRLKPTDEIIWALTAPVRLSGSSVTDYMRPFNSTSNLRFKLKTQVTIKMN